MNLNFVKEYHIEAKKLIAIAIPILLAQIAQNSMGMVDTIMAGRVSAADMAAISVGASIWLPLVLFGHGLLLALPPTISYLNGSGQRKRIAHQVRQGIWIVFFSCIPLGLLIYHSDVVLQNMDMEPRLAEITSGYLHAMIWGLPGYLLMINFRCLNDGIAKTKPAMVIAFLGLMLNIPLNYIFIYGKLGIPAFGAVGCGIATTIVNWVMCLLMLTYCMRARNQRDLKVFDKIIERPNVRTLSKLLKLGFPIAMALCCEVALFALTSLFLSPLGADVVASHQIALNTSSFVFMLPMSIKSATSSRVMSGIASLYQFSDTVQVIIGGVLRGYKDTKAILYITLFCYWVVGMPLGYMLARTDLIITGGIAAKGFWIAFIVSLTLAAILLIYRLRKIQRLPDEVLLARLEKLK